MKWKKRLINRVKMEGVFTISLDFELHWGVYDKKNRETRMACYQNTLAIIPQLLELFDKYNVHVTWATVGSLFAANKQEWEQLMPANQPEYGDPTLSPYYYVAKNGLEAKDKSAHFAPEMVQLILNHEGQELGTHTFGHFYCLEQVKDNGAFDADLKAASKAAEKFNFQPISLVFPRNQFNTENLNACTANNIKVVRSNPATWFWTPIRDSDTGMLRKIFRTGDAYVPMSSVRNSYSLTTISKKKGQPLQLPASRLLRSWSPKYPIANKLALGRVINELTVAAHKKECYHLWWHPENFGDYPEQNLQNLETILKEYQMLQKRFGMQSWNMGEYLQYV